MTDTLPPPLPPCTCGRPSPGELVEAVCLAYTQGYDRGVIDGHAQAVEDAHAAELHAAAAEVARNAAQDIGIRERREVAA